MSLLTKMGKRRQNDAKNDVEKRLKRDTMYWRSRQYSLSSEGENSLYGWPPIRLVWIQPTK